MIIVNKDLRIDTYEKVDLAYLVSSPDRFEVSRSVTNLLRDIKVNPVVVEEYLTEHGVVSLETRRALIDAKLVVSIDESSERVASKLRSRNWMFSGDYLRRTYDYPFFDYKEDGWSRDARMMGQYLSLEVEIERSRKKEGGTYVVHLQDPLESLDSIRHRINVESLDFVFKMVVATFGVKNRSKISGSIPIYKKTIPSGGGRHPTECYVIDIQKQDVYHYCSEDNSFGKIGGVFSANEFSSCFGEPNGYVSFDVHYVVLLTCVWERNMFRYREPRTFRSVHIDAGHAAANIDLLALGAGLNSKVQYGFNSLSVESLFNLDPLDEGVMCALMIGGKR